MGIWCLSVSIRPVRTQFVSTCRCTERSQNWLTFLHNHTDVSWGMDFFIVPAMRGGNAMTPGLSGGNQESGEHNFRECDSRKSRKFHFLPEIIVYARYPDLLLSRLHVRTAEICFCRWRPILTDQLRIGAVSRRSRRILCANQYFNPENTPEERSPLIVSCRSLSNGGAWQYSRRLPWHRKEH